MIKKNNEREEKGPNEEAETLSWFERISRQLWKDAPLKQVNKIISLFIPFFIFSLEDFYFFFLETI